MVWRTLFVKCSRIGNPGGEETDYSIIGSLKVMLQGTIRNDDF